MGKVKKDEIVKWAHAKGRKKGEALDVGETNSASLAVPKIKRELKKL